MNQDSSRPAEPPQATAPGAAYRDLIIRTAMSFIDLPLERMDAGIQQALADIGGFFGADRAYVFQYDFETRLARNTHEWCAPGITPHIEDLQALDVSHLDDWVRPHRNGQPLVVPEVDALEDSSLRDVLVPQGICSLLTAPLMDGENCAGFVGLDAVRGPLTYGHDETEMLRLFALLLVNLDRRKRAAAELAASAYEKQLAYQALERKTEELARTNAQLERLAHYDNVTQLPNRNLLSDRLIVSMRQADRRRNGLAIVYLDLDGFKAINDSHGHDVGDLMLAQLARQMSGVLRDGDTLGRLGGDEFVAVLIDLSDEQLLQPLMLRLLNAASEPIELNGLTLQVSASAGVALYPQDKPLDADQLLRQADHAMYQAKLAGRNQYCLFDSTRDQAVQGRAGYSEPQ